MSFYLWTDKLSIGNDQIDRDHKKMVFYVNEMHHAITTIDQAKHRNHKVIENLNALVGHTREHFHREEQEMERWEYHLLEVHRCEHRALMTEIVRIQDRFNSDKHLMTLLEVKMLKEWVNHHIVDGDKEMSMFIFDKKKEKRFSDGPSIRVF